MGHFLNPMLDPFVDGRTGVFGPSGDALGCPQPAPLPSELAFAYSSLKAPPMQRKLRDPLERVGRRLCGTRPTAIRWCSAATISRARIRGLRRRPRLSPIARQCCRSRTRRRRRQLEPRPTVSAAARATPFRPASTAPPKYGPGLSRRRLRLHQSLDVTDRFAVGDHLTASFNAQSYGGRIEAAIASRHGTAASRPTPRSRRRASARPVTARPTPPAGALGSGTFPHRHRHGGTSSAPASTACSLFIPMPYFRCARGSPGRTTGERPALAPVFQALPGATLSSTAPRRRRTPRSSAGTDFAANGMVLLAKFDGEFARHSSTYAGTGTVRYTW